MTLTEKQELFLKFVKEQHGEQKRKYTGEPYWTHTYDVAKRVDQFIKTPGAIEIALGHDLVEDTPCTDILLFGKLILIGYSDEEAKFITEGIMQLTDIYTKESFPELNRRKRKDLEAERLGKNPFLTQSIKYADLENNTQSITQHDPDFAVVYLNEKIKILNQMQDGHTDLLIACQEALGQGFKLIEEHKANGASKI